MNVGRFQAGVYQAGFVEKIEGGENGTEHTAGFVGRQRALRKELAEILVRKFGNDVETRRAADNATSGMKNFQNAGMRQYGDGTPASETIVGSGGIFGDEFDGGVGSGVARTSGSDGSQEDGGIGRDAEKFAEGEAAVRELSEKMLRCVWHRAPPVRARSSVRRE